MNKPIALRCVLGAAALCLSACGGGGGVSAPVADTVPASATASPEAFTRYAATLPEDDRREPLSVDGLVPPTSETTEPIALAR